MGNFIIYNTEGYILRTGSCPDSMIKNQIVDGEFVISGEADQETQKVVNHIVCDKTQTEIDEYRLTRQHMKRLHFTGTETDKELNQTISEHFYGLVDPEQYRIEHYVWIREKFYPHIRDYLDAQVKSRSTKDDERIKGKEQLATYDAACWAVKERFPKK